MQSALLPFHPPHHTCTRTRKMCGSTSFSITATDQPSMLPYVHVNETHVCIIPMHQITVTMSVLQEALFCPTVQLKNVKSKVDVYEEGRDDGVKVELVKVLDENKDEDWSPAPTVYGRVRRKLFRSPKFFPKILWASSGPEEWERVRERRKRGQGDHPSCLASHLLVLGSSSGRGLGLCGHDDVWGPALCPLSAHAGQNGHGYGLGSCTWAHAIWPWRSWGTQCHGAVLDYWSWRTCSLTHLLHGFFSWRTQQPWINDAPLTEQKNTIKKSQLLRS